MSDDPIFNHRRSGTGPTDFQVFSSLDGFAQPVATFDVPGTGDILDETINLGSAFADVAVPVTFRFHGFNATGTGGTWRLLALRVVGSTAPTTP